MLWVVAHIVRHLHPCPSACCWFRPKADCHPIIQPPLHTTLLSVLTAHPPTPRQFTFYFLFVLVSCLCVALQTNVYDEFTVGSLPLTPNAAPSLSPLSIFSSYVVPRKPAVGAQGPPSGGLLHAAHPQHAPWKTWAFGSVAEIPSLATGTWCRFGDLPCRHIPTRMPLALYGARPETPLPCR